ncbi:methyltransferase domain-containing protein [Microbacterium sp. ASV81]|uniref:Methyltransferase domain-containing protein n=1 Tax=Microbacterium capsulatum TaxID=3041921 RepID=A0ABU0XCT9_9MICO|nr:methyltransferase domain-containing protein [Microbacterium sp. ASV81]MDQ4212927.1 methyltransferase domain-containing protein [Microbacterium sp. ASV81]
MDDPDADQRTLDRTYELFRLVNTVVSRPGALYRRDVRPRARAGRVRILDVGAGGGDLCRALARRLARDGLDAEITALDADERATRWAAAHDGGAGVVYRCARSAELVRAGERYDVVLSNHVLHHLAADELQGLLEDSRRLVGPDGLVAHHDIARGRIAYALFAAGSLPFARNVLSGSFIRADGLTSIRRSYTAAELADLAPDGWRVLREAPARLQLRWEPRDARP